MAGDDEMLVPQNQQELLLSRVDELERCLRRAITAMTETYKIQAKKARLSSPNVPKFARSPSSSTRRAIVKELVHYDAVCDTIQDQLSTAIAVVQRDIDRERARIRELSRVAAEEPIVGSPTTVQEVSTVVKEDSPAPQSDNRATIPQLPPNYQMGVGLAGSLTAAQARRPSTVSLSSLRGPRIGAPFNLKLDLSSTALRMDDSMIPGLFSPVMLAPRTGMPQSSIMETDATNPFGGHLTSTLGHDLDNTVPGLDLDAIHLDLIPTAESGEPLIDGTSQPPLTLELADLGEQDMESLFGDVASAVDNNTPIIGVQALHSIHESSGEQDNGLFTPDETTLSRMDSLDGSLLLPTVAGLEADLDLDQESMLLNSHLGVKDDDGLVDGMLLDPLPKNPLLATGNGETIGEDFGLGLDFDSFSPGLFSQLADEQGLTNELDLMNNMLEEEEKR